MHTAELKTPPSQLHRSILFSPQIFTHESEQLLPVVKGFAFCSEVVTPEVTEPEVTVFVVMEPDVMMFVVMEPVVKAPVMSICEEMKLYLLFVFHLASIIL